MLLSIANPRPYFIDEIKEITAKKLQTCNLCLERSWVQYPEENKLPASLVVAGTYMFTLYLVWQKDWRKLLEIPVKIPTKKSKISAGGVAE